MSSLQRGRLAVAALLLVTTALLAGLLRWAVESLPMTYGWPPVPVTLGQAVTLMYAGLVLFGLLAALATWRSGRLVRLLLLAAWASCGGAVIAFARFAMAKPLDEVQRYVGDDLVGIVAPPQGNRIFVAADNRGRPRSCPQCIFEIDTGQEVSLPADDGFLLYERGNHAEIQGIPLTFSADGLRVAWLQRVGPSESSDLALRVWDLRFPERPPLRVRLPSCDDGTDIALSPGALFVALLSGSHLQIIEPGTNKPPRVVEVPAAPTSRIRTSRNHGVIAMHFISETRLRLVQARACDDGCLEPFAVHEVDVVAPRLMSLGLLRTRAPVTSWNCRMVIDPAGDRAVLLANRFQPCSTAELFDLGRAARLATLVEASEWGRLDATFLSDGSVLTLEASPEGTLLQTFSVDGALVASATLDVGRRPALGGEPVRGRVTVASGGRDYSLLLVDPVTGRGERLAKGLLPLRPHRRFMASAVVSPLAGSIATKLFRGYGGSIVYLDPVSGRRAAVVSP